MRPSTITLGFVVTTLSACGGGSLGTSGAAGTVGTGEGATGGTVTVGIAGAVGTGGGVVGGTGGTGGTPPACGGGGPDVVELMVMGADGMPVAARVTAAVTVTAIESCADVNCSSPTTTAASRIALAGAASQQWTLYLRNTAMPSDVIKVGDTFDLTIDASEDQTLYRSVNQTVVLSRYGHVIVFAANLSRFGGPPLPNLLPFQIAVSDEGATCESSSLGCRQRPHALRVSAATSGYVVITGGRTGRIGPFSITNGRMDESVDTGFCDSKSQTVMAGFRLGGTCNLSSTQGDDGIVDAQNAQVSAPVTAAVTVAAVEVPTTSTTVNVKLADAASSRYWIWSLATPTLPANRIKVGDHFDLTIDARECEVPFLRRPCQTVVLAQGSKIVAFTVDLWGNEPLPTGALDSWGVGLVDAGVTCTQMSPSCEYRYHALQLTSGSEAKVLTPGGSTSLGDLSITLDRFYDVVDHGSCDGGGRFAMNGFRIP